MSDPFDSLEFVMASLKQMEATLLGVQQLRQYVGDRPGKEMLDALIQEAESQFAEIKRMVIQ